MNIKRWFERQDLILAKHTGPDVNLSIKTFCAKHWWTLQVPSLQNALMIHTSNCRHNDDMQLRVNRLIPEYDQEIIEAVQERLDDDKMFTQILQERIAELGGDA